MPQPSRQSVEIRDFEGLQTSVGTLDAAPGAADVQVNAACIKPGELTVRRGLRLLTFDNE